MIFKSKYFIFRPIPSSKMSLPNGEHFCDFDVINDKKEIVGRYDFITLIEMEKINLDYTLFNGKWCMRVYPHFLKENSYLIYDDIEHKIKKGE